MSRQLSQLEQIRPGWQCVLWESRQIRRKIFD